MTSSVCSGTSYSSSDSSMVSPEFATAGSLVEPVRLIARDLDPLWYRHVATFALRKVRPILWMVLVTSLRTAAPLRWPFRSGLVTTSSMTPAWGNRSARVPCLKMAATESNAPTRSLSVVLVLSNVCAVQSKNCDTRKDRMQKAFKDSCQCFPTSSKYQKSRGKFRPIDTHLC